MRLASLRRPCRSHLGAASHDIAGTDPDPCGPGLHVTSAVVGAHVPGAHTVRSGAQPPPRIARTKAAASPRHSLGRRRKLIRIIYSQVPLSGPVDHQEIGESRPSPGISSEARSRPLHNEFGPCGARRQFLLPVMSIRRESSASRLARLGMPLECYDVRNRPP